MPPTVRDVHILPVGREVDRAVLPFLPRQRPDGATAPALLYAHRILLLVPASPAAQAVATRISLALEDRALVEHIGLAHDPDRPVNGFETILQQLACLCRREVAAGHRVHINLSSGSKLVALAAGLVGMAHLGPASGSLYHVQPTGQSLSDEEFGEHGATLGLMDVEEVELVPIPLPPVLQRRVLGRLRLEGDASYRDLVEFLCAIPGSGYQPLPDHGRSGSNVTTTRMVRSIVNPLVAAGLLEVSETGRQKTARATRRGRLYAALAGDDAASLRQPLASNLEVGGRPAGLEDANGERDAMARADAFEAFAVGPPT